MQWDFHPRAFLLRHVHVVCVNTPEDGLVRHDNDIVVLLKLHDDRLQADHHVPVRLSTPVPIVVFVVVSRYEVFRVELGNLLVRETVTDT